MKKPISVSNLTIDLWLDYVRPAAMTAGILEETTENDGTREYTTEIAPEAVADEVAHCMYCACMNSHIYNNDYTKEGEAKQMLYQLSVSMKYDLHDTAEDVTKLYNALSAMLGPDRPTDSTHAEEEGERRQQPTQAKAARPGRKGERKMRAIKNRTYYNFLRVMKVILAKGYERDEAAQIVRNIFDEFEACPAGLSVLARADLILSADEYRQTYGK